MALGKRALRSKDYTIGLFCALPLELAALTSILDEEHDEPLSSRQDNDNVNTFGRIGKHNVIITCLSSGEMGSVSAGILANSTRRSFPSIMIGLLVGIGGGIPDDKNDIRLGDVVVSKPTKEHGGVIQWDFGKIGSNRKFERRGHLNRPPKLLRSAVSKLEGQEKAGLINDFEKRLEQIHSLRPRMSQTYTHQGTENDRLFLADYEHPDNNKTCDRVCNTSKIEERKPRESQIPMIHYGNIASGSKVIANAQERDLLQKELGVLCVEMEAAGLMNDFPCLIIKGISDYADTHKNDIWQDYAAITAALYAKRLLAEVPYQALSESNDYPLGQKLEDTDTILNPSSIPSPKRYDSPFYRLDSSPKFINTLPSSEKEKYWTQLTQPAFQVYEMVYDEMHKTRKGYVQLSSFLSHFETDDSLQRKIPDIWNRLCTEDLCAPRGYILAMLFMLHIETERDFRHLQVKSKSDPGVDISENAKTYLALWGVWVDCCCSAVPGGRPCGFQWTFPAGDGFFRGNGQGGCLVLNSRRPTMSSEDQARGEAIYRKNVRKWRRSAFRQPVELKYA